MNPVLFLRLTLAGQHKAQAHFSGLLLRNLNEVTIIGVCIYIVINMVPPMQ